jgi:hypothetical protein
MPKETITRGDYHALVGMLELARRHRAHLDELERAAAELLGIPPEAHSGGDYFGHVSDAIAGLVADGSGVAAADALLLRLEIRVSPPIVTVERGGGS